MRFLFIVLSFMIVGCRYQNGSDTVRIHGNFPAVKGGEFRLAFYRGEKLKKIEMPLQNGKFDIKLDSPITGEYNFSINWPIPESKRYRVYEDETGKTVREKYAPGIMTHYTLSKKLYINPEQANDYAIYPEREITPQMIDSFKTSDYDRPDRFRLKLTSGSEDALYFEKLDSLAEYYDGFNVYRIGDSLRRMGTTGDGRHIRDLATEINKQQNRPSYLKARRALAHAHPDNPIAAMDMLSLPNDELRANATAYRKLLDRLEGRAKQSEYYERATAKLATALTGPAEVGAVFRWPEGWTPEDAAFDVQTALPDYSHVLVEYWASWCVPCREQNPAWNKLLAKYEEQGFRILGVSLDQDIDAWRHAITEDRLSDWLHVSDHRAFDGLNAITNKIQAIPYNVLVDRDGRVVMKHCSPLEVDSLLSRAD